jgi:hypothetical protein
VFQTREEMCVVFAIEIVAQTQNRIVQKSQKYYEKSEMRYCVRRYVFLDN